MTLCEVMVSPPGVDTQFRNGGSLLFLYLPVEWKEYWECKDKERSDGAWVAQSPWEKHPECLVTSVKLSFGTLSLATCL